MLLSAFSDGWNETPAGRLWAVLYRGEEVTARELVRSVRRGRRRVTDMLLAAADAAQPPWRTRFG